MAAAAQAVQLDREVTTEAATFPAEEAKGHQEALHQVEAVATTRGAVHQAAGRRGVPRPGHRRQEEAAATIFCFALC